MAFIDSEENNITETLADPQGSSLLNDVISDQIVPINNPKTNVIFTNKYEPKRLSDVLIDTNNKKKIMNFVKNKHIPNMILVGDFGIGKTTIARCIARDTLNNSSLFMEVDVLDEKNSVPITESIENFCRKKVNNGEFKIILFDDIENMTVKLQQSISSMMEKISNVIFIFTSNDLNDILDSIQSKCVTLRLDKPNDNDLFVFLTEICKKENIKYTKQGIQTIIHVSKSDIRNCVTNLQSIITTYNEVKEDAVYKIYNRPQPHLVRQILLYCYKDDIVNAFKMIQNMWNIGYSSNDICASMFDELRDQNFVEIPNNIKRNFMEQIGKTALIINKGVDTHLQLSACICKLLKRSL